MDGIAILILLILFASFALLARPGLRRDDAFRRGGRLDSNIDRELYRATHTDATGVLRCRRCGAEGSERAGVCPRCGAAL